MEFYTVGDYQRNWNRTISISIGIVESRWEGGEEEGLLNSEKLRKYRAGNWK